MKVCCNYFLIVDKRPCDVVSREEVNKDDIRLSARIQLIGLRPGYAACGRGSKDNIPQTVRVSPGQ